MRRAAAGLLALALLTAALVAWGSRRTLVCLGDSNTAAKPSWCDMLQVLLPAGRWRIVNRGQPLAISSYDGEFPRNGKSQLRKSLAADSADAVVFAFGTNDLALGYLVTKNLELPMGREQIETVVENLRRLRETAHLAGIRSFVASTPPLATQNKPEYRPVNDLVAQLNQRLRSAIPAAELIDFDSAMDPFADYKDAFHMNAEGQVKHAVAACTVLMNAYCPAKAEACTARASVLREMLKRSELKLLPRASRKPRPAWKTRARPLPGAARPAG